MPPYQTFEAMVAGPCDFCPGYFEAGDYVAQPESDKVMCPQCVNEHREKEAA
jgi:hypothetical protein